MPDKPCGSFEIVESFDAYEFLSNDVEEFSSDISDVDKMLSSLQVVDGTNFNSR